MSTFEASRDLFSQYHFTVVEFDVPIVESHVNFSASIEDPDPEWYWRLDETSGIIAVDEKSNGDLEYESNANTAGYSVSSLSTFVDGQAKDIDGDSARQIFDNSPVTDNGTAIPIDFLVAWTFNDEVAGGDDPTPARALDTTFTSNKTLLFGNSPTVLISGWIEEGVEFDGINQYGFAQVLTSYRAANISLLIAAKIPSISAYAGIWSFRSTGATSKGWELIMTSAGKIRFNAYDESATPIFTVTTDLSYDDDIFYRIVLTYDEVNVKIYVDGALVKAQEETQALNLTNVVSFEIGRTESANYLEATIDEPQYFDRAISNDEVISDHLNSGAVLFESGSLTSPDFTIECAFTIDTATLNMHLLGKMTNTIEYAIRLDTADNNVLVLDLFQFDNTDRETELSSDLSSDGVTANGDSHYLSVRMDFSGTGLLTCEIDGVEVLSVDVSTWSGDWRQDFSSIFTIGADGESGSNIWNGKVDEVAIYLKAITDEQRLSNYGWWNGDLSAVEGFGTPLSSEDAITGTRTYKFTTSDAPGLTESGIFRNIDSINETVAKLSPQAGLASRGSGQITMVDFKGDPNPNASEVTDEVIASSTFLAKLDARNILTNRDLRIKNYRLEADESMDLAAGAETRHYIIESFDNLGGDKWGIRIKDELSRVNLDETIFPPSSETTLTAAINDSAIIIPVNDGTKFAVAGTFRIGSELMKIISISVNDLTVITRGNDITYTNTLSKTDTDSHESGDEVFICDVSDNEDIDIFLARVLIDVGVDASFIPTADWAAEIADWHPNDKINTLWIESLDTLEVLKRVLGDFLMDMWFDPVAREIKLSAVSQWKEASITITEGNEIDFETIRRMKEETLRYTRALVVYDKRFLAKDDSVENFRKASLFKRTDLEGVGAFGEIKTKRFESSFLLTKNSADLLVNRYVSRNVNPHSYKWNTQERKLNFDVGDVVNIVSNGDVDFNGSTESGSRAQIMSIKPTYGGVGRVYNVTALSYEPVLGDSEIIITGNIFNLNLHTHVGAPVDAVEMTFVFDAAVLGSTSGLAAIVAGNFDPASKIIIILANGADLQSKGGRGGNGQSISFDFESSTWDIDFPADNGSTGAIVYDAQGIDTDIHFSGATPSTAFPTADGFIRAPSGGDGGFNGIFTDGNPVGIGGDGGDGGNGINPGKGGQGGHVEIPPSGTDGDNGIDGSTSGPWGVAGANNDATGGASGSGVIDNGATVTFFGDTAARYINGSGDHP